MSQGFAINSTIPALPSDATQATEFIENLDVLLDITVANAIEYLNRVRIINFPPAQQLIEQYIRFYNLKRLNSAIDYLTPYQKGNTLRNAA